MKANTDTWLEAEAKFNEETMTDPKAGVKLTDDEREMVKRFRSVYGAESVTVAMIEVIDRLTAKPDEGS